MKDLSDIAYLAVLNDLDLEVGLEPLCDRYGSPDVYKLIANQLEALR